MFPPDQSAEEAKALKAKFNQLLKEAIDRLEKAKEPVGVS
jgi:ElaB/YqjD/DUF883 family membrane-anchored ribosome-binding protein